MQGLTEILPGQLVDRAELEIPGAPVEWARAGKRGKVHFTRPAQRAHMTLIEQCWMVAGRPQLPDVALTLSAQFWLPHPPTHYGTGRNAGVLKPSAPPRPTGVPDLSNFLKLLEDALNGRLWRDDAQIVCLSGIHKHYADTPEKARTVVTVWAARVQGSPSNSRSAQCPRRPAGGIRR